MAARNMPTYIVKFIPQSSQHILVHCRYGIPDSVFDLLYGLAEKLEIYVCVKNKYGGEWSVVKKKRKLQALQIVCQVVATQYEAEQTTALYVFQIAITNTSTS
jgi:hypothetical protein